VLFLVFNRLDTTKQVFEAIRQAKPPRLYVAADGARENREGEEQKVKAVREYILSNIDWECEVKTLFREENLGCKYAVSGAITWFFENEEMGIILEDDCLPSQSFFWFCEELLIRYQENNNIGIITGSNYFFEEKDIEEDYYFSVFSFVWGWASWKKVWEKYDVDMKSYPEFKKKNKLKDIFLTKPSLSYWSGNFEATFKGKIDTWDYQLSYMSCNNALLNIVPSRNLISNIGYGSDATHTKANGDKHENMKRYELEFPLKYQENIIRSVFLDEKFEKLAFSKNSIVQRLVKGFFKR
jgi:hypothetical protein